jgi:hypothetical protein
VLLMSPHILLDEARRSRKLDHSEKIWHLLKINSKNMHFEENP